MAIGFAIATKKLYPIFKRGCGLLDWGKSFDWKMGSGISIAGLVGIGIVLIAIIITQIGDIAKCTLFPEMYIFEYLKTLM